MTLPLSGFAALVGLIYDAAVAPERWPTAIDAVRAALGYEIAIVAQHALPTGRVLLDETANIPEPWASARGRYQDAAVALWGGPSYIQHHPFDRPAVLSRVAPGAPQDMRNDWVREWAAPQGLVDHLALVLARDGGASGCVGFGRHGARGPIDDGDVEAMTLLMPHLQRAAAIGRLLDAQSARATDLAMLLDRVTTPVFLLGADGTMLHRNTSAGALLAEGTPLQLRGVKLGSPVGDVDRALASAVHHCSRQAMPPHHRAFGIPARGRDGSLHALHVLPLSATPSPRRLDRRAAAAVFVSSPRSRPGASADLVMALYGLTQAEGRAFELVARGRTTQEAAATLKVSVSTFKTHLLRVFAKVGVHRQADLARLAAALDAPVSAR